DVSSVALDRAREHARAAAVEIRLLHSGLVEAALPAGEFDLVSAQYPALLKTADHAPERALLAAVAPGGTLLVVHHVIDADHAHADRAQNDPDQSDPAHSDHTRTGGFDPTVYVTPGDVAARLDADWQLEVHAERERRIIGGAGAHHTRDVVVRVRRLR
ncbi:MAG TPA: hypothetical protein VFP34_15425, partial [Microlunatus sp.]|nr:hypothetical protein [Microlunatus sp.]